MTAVPTAACKLYPGALKLLQYTFTPLALRAVLRRWWSRDLFGCHYSTITAGRLIMFVPSISGCAARFIIIRSTTQITVNVFVPRRFASTVTSAFVMLSCSSAHSCQCCPSFIVGGTIICCRIQLTGLICLLASIQRSTC